MQLKPQEEALHDKMPPHLQRILQGKRLLLWKEILQELGYADWKIVDEAIEGFRITGWTPEAGIFPADVRQPAMTEKQLQGIAIGLNKAVVESIRVGAPTDLDQVAVEETWKEVEKGWLKPCMNIDLHNHHIAKRFPIQQNEKVRLIDDVTVCGVNGTVGLPERLRVESIEDLTAALLVGMDMKGTTSGEIDLCGRTYDLKSAYKQFGVSKECADRMNVALKHPTSGIAYFDVLALPFGATASVSAFLRLSASIAFIGAVALKICWIVFFDDYSVVCPRQQAREVGFFVESLFKLLGVKYAADGDKATPFDSVFKTLGLQLDLSCWNKGFFRIGHTESRRTELLSDLKKLLAEGTVVTKELERLHGRLVWMRAFVFGRRLHAAVSAVSKLARLRARSFTMTSELQSALETLLTRLEIAEALKVLKPSLQVVHVYTDGAFEPDTATPGSIGAVLTDSVGTPPRILWRGGPAISVGRFVVAFQTPDLRTGNLAGCFGTGSVGPTFVKPTCCFPSGQRSCPQCFYSSNRCH